DATVAARPDPRRLDVGPRAQELAPRRVLAGSTVASGARAGDSGGRARFALTCWRSRGPPPLGAGLSRGSGVARPAIQRPPGRRPARGSATGQIAPPGEDHRARRRRGDSTMDQSATPPARGRHLSLSQLPLRLHHHAFVVRDQEANRRFFEDILGLPLVATW